MDDSASKPPCFERAAALAERVRAGVLKACDPALAVERAWVADEWRGRPVRVLAAGKASAAMARRTMALLRHESAIVTGALVVTTAPGPAIPGAQVLVADHPLPTARNLAASRQAQEFVGAGVVGEGLLVLLSGGASALLTSPADGLTLEDLREATAALLRGGASIGELNAVRKHAETLKGGRLARLIGGGAERGRAVVLVLSDVLGDRLDVIASGPLTPDPTTYAQALAALRRPAVVVTPGVGRVIAHLERGARGFLGETPEPGDPAFAGIEHRVIAGNQHATVAARDTLLACGIERVKVVCRVEGEAVDVGHHLVRDMARYAAEAPGLASAVVYGGETTVTVGQGTGKGGRNQELALASAIALRDMGLDGVVFTLATDGVDGPTDAAGAVVTSTTPIEAARLGVDLDLALRNHDSHRALAALGALVRTGPTGTNVNDLAVGVVWG